MSRPLRIEFAGALYNVTSRQDGQEVIILGEEDRRRFLDVLSELVHMCSRIRQRLERSFLFCSLIVQECHNSYRVEKCIDLILLLVNYERSDSRLKFIV